MRNGVCAIGFTEKGDLRRLAPSSLNRDTQLFLEIGKGDLILAYATGNMIAYVGDVVDGANLFNTKNEVDRDFDYHNQKRVAWWDEPNHFKRTNILPFSDQLGKRGKTVVRLDLGPYSFDKAIEVIKACAITGSASSELNEDMVKMGLRTYMKNHLDFLGLRIMKPEVQITPESRPDFIAADSTGKKVLVECKGTASAAACDQLLRYREAYRGKPRMILVAFSFDNECKKQAKKNGIELIECHLTPRRAL